MHEDMLRRVSRNGCKGLTRDVELEAQVKEAINSDGYNEEESDKAYLEDADGDTRAFIDHISVWRGSLEDVMRAVVAEDTTRKRSRREFNPAIQEWLGED